MWFRRLIGALAIALVAAYVIGDLVDPMLGVAVGAVAFTLTAIAVSLGTEYEGEYHLRGW